MKRLQIGIRDFALPVPRRGSIELHSGYGPIPITGQEIHLRTQADLLSQFSQYRPEVWVSYSFDREGHSFTINGRMDGVYEGTPATIEEIKTAFNINDLYQKLKSDPDHPYCLQLKTYAYIMYLQTGVMPNAKFRLVSMRKKEHIEMDLELDVQKYEEWLALRIQELMDEAKQAEAQSKRRKKHSKEIEFPFVQPRPSQMDLVRAVEMSLEGEAPLMIQAPTGMGKTAAVVFPVMKEAFKRGERVIYVTPKNSQHSVAEETVKLFQDQGHSIRALTLRSKAKLCMKAEPICNPTFCEYAKDHYTKVAENKVLETLSKKKKVTYRSIKRLAQTFEVCPHELQMEATQSADVVIGDYNYVFAPRNSLARLAPEGTAKTKRPNLIIDEAHNLPSRATGYFSPGLSSFVFDLMIPGFQRLNPYFGDRGIKLVEECLNILWSYEPPLGMPAEQVTLDSAVFLEQAEKIKDYLQTYLESDAVIEPRDPVLQLSNYWINFAEATLLSGDGFFTTASRQNKGISLKITCCDASFMLKETYGSFAHVVAFSATMKPFEYYSKLSGLESVKTNEFQSPFPRENRKLLVIPQVSTKYSVRHSNYSKISGAIEKIVTIHPGNYFVFFPSFDFLDKVLQQVKLPEFSFLRQHSQMTNAQVEDYLAHMKNPEKPVLLFGVQGGVFSEGVDYPGDMAIGAIIVGPGIPTYDLERELLRKFYEKNYGEGFNYAYAYPAMAKVVQSAGRVIRSETDRGLIVLMDDRFLTKSFSGSMPLDWFKESPKELVSNEILKDIAEFWEGPVNL
jgi:DNA excision repair protein ERCC-2